MVTRVNSVDHLRSVTAGIHHAGAFERLLDGAICRNKQSAAKCSDGEIVSSVAFDAVDEADDCGPGWCVMEEPEISNQSD